MCTLAILRRPDHAWPVVIGANRDEMIDRPARPPARHWPDRPRGRRRARRTGRRILARAQRLGRRRRGAEPAWLARPAADRRSRGELVLEALDHADAVAAAEALSHLDPASYRTFNLIVADNRDAFWLRHAEGKRIEVHPLADGLSLIAAGEVNELATPRLKLAMPRFRAAVPPEPDRDDWAEWQDLLGDDTVPPGMSAEAALRFRSRTATGRFRVR